jgi:hypothetical protein
LEGTSSAHLLFSDLTVDTLKNLSADMGVLVDQNHFDAFDIMKELEISRNKLYAKTTKKVNNVQIEEVVEIVMLMKG